jgi:anti-sigma B factor antagonist
MSRRPSKCRTHKIGNVNVLKVIGRLTPDENEDILFNAVKQLDAAGESLYLLDLSAVNYINSTGIGSIIQAFRLAQSKGGDLKILNPSQCVSQIIQISKLDSIFKIYHNQETAVASFAELPPPPPPDDKPAETPKRGRPRKQSTEDKPEEGEE